MSSKYTSKLKKLKERNELKNRVKKAKGLSDYIEDNRTEEQKLDYIKSLLELKQQGHVDIEFIEKRETINLLVAPLTDFGHLAYKQLRGKYGLTPNKYKPKNLEEANKVMKAITKREIERGFQNENE